jgi:hypothetical protein
MNERDFCYWLQGFFEIHESNEVDEKQIQIIKDHLKTVFEKVTPDRSAEQVKEDALKAIEAARKSMEASMSAKGRYLLGGTSQVKIC